jgi:hypothetical protein
MTTGTSPKEQLPSETSASRAARSLESAGDHVASPSSATESPVRNQGGTVTISRTKRFAVVAAVALSLAGQVSRTSASPPSTEPVDPSGNPAATTADPLPPQPQLPNLDEIARSLSQRKGITLADAQLAVNANGPIIDFISEHERDPAFGSVWVTHDGRFEMHVRTLDASLDREIADLERDVGVVAVRHEGGSPWHLLHDLARRVFDERLEVGYSINHVAGTFDVYAGRPLLDGLYNGADVRDVAPPKGPAELFTNAGDGARLWDGSAWTPWCTAGFMYEGVGFSGFGTAAHCEDDSWYVYGQYGVVGTMRYEDCYTDVQMKDFTGAPTLGSYMREPRTGTFTLISAMATGYYVGQDTFKIGLYTGTNTSGTGNVTGFGTLPLPGNSECPAAIKGALQYDNVGKFGDSGGPTALLYNGTYRLASTVVGVSGGVYIGSWLNWLTIPGSGHFCTSAHLC